VVDYMLKGVDNIAVIQSNALIFKERHVNKLANEIIYNRQLALQKSEKNEI